MVHQIVLRRSVLIQTTNLTVTVKARDTKTSRTKAKERHTKSQLPESFWQVIPHGFPGCFWVPPCKMKAMHGNQYRPNNYLIALSRFSEFHPAFLLSKHWYLRCCVGQIKLPRYDLLVYGAEPIVHTPFQENHVVFLPIVKILAFTPSNW